MQCAVCKANVENFHLKSFNVKEAVPRSAQANATDSLLPSAFDVNPFLVPPTNLAVPRSSTPVGFTCPTARGRDPPVLRIDNVPWVCPYSIDLSSVLTQIKGHHPSHDHRVAEAARYPCSRLA